MGGRGLPGSVVSPVGIADASVPTGANEPEVRSIGGGVDAGVSTGPGTQRLSLLAGGASAGVSTGAM
eukprot:2012702-Pyramimonas_sp.AAC.1